MFAELAYLFRHALLRDAAYELQLPQERARLHALAHDIIEQVYAAHDQQLDAVALELASHAGIAGAALRDDRLLAREAHWLQRAGVYAHEHWRGAEAVDLLLRAAAHEAANEQQRSQARRRAGKVLLDLGRLQQAREVLETALREAPDDAATLDALRPLGYAYRNLGMPADALGVAERNAALAEKSGNQTDRVLALDALATALTGLERLAEARAPAEEALQLARQFCEARLLGGILSNVGILRGRLGDSERALALLTESVRVLEQTDDRRVIAVARRNLADRLRMSWQLDEAERECQLALAEMREVGDRRGEGMALLTLGGIRRDQGRPAEGAPLSREAGRILLESGDVRAAASAFCNAAAALLDVGDYAKCEELLQSALPLASSGGATRALTMVQVVFGDLRRDQRRWAEAAEWHRQAFEGYQRIGDNRQAAWQIAERAVSLRMCADPAAEEAWEAATAALRAGAPEDLQGYVEKWSAAAPEKTPPRARDG
ncbi:MAG: tetratricopeptide repeat protein [Planctomycetes bacterium]|nr:tetratricopeptide repeat protein [Planctomycetota bacterium]